MTKAEKVEFIMEKLDELFPDPPVPLDHKDPYTLLVAVLLSAQCTDERVNKVTPHLFDKADNPGDMAQLEQEEIREIIKPCGLSPTKSKAIKELSEIIMKQYAAKVPESIEELEKLPGVGHKTASVVVSQAFGQPAFPVDTHIHRLMYRWGLSNGKNVQQTEKDAKRLFPKEAWNKVHIQIILYGRKYSPARGFKLENSPIDQRVMRKSLIKEYQS